MKIKVTPLVDVYLVMLIIFMVVTPMIVERVQLPRTARPDERKPKRSEQVRLVVGYPRRELWLEDDIVEESLLVEKLKEIKERVVQKGSNQHYWSSTYPVESLGLNELAAIRERVSRARLRRCHTD